MSDDANVSNSPTASNADIPVRMLEISATGKKVQVVALGFVEGGALSLVESGTGMPVNIVGGSISASLASAATVSEGRVLVDDTAGGTQILAANASRKGGEVRVHLSSQIGVYIKRGTSCDNSARYYAPGDTVKLADGAYKYTGAVFAFVDDPSITAYVEFTEG